MNLRHLTILASAAVASASGQAIKLDMFDLNQNGLYEASERKAAARHQASPAFHEADTDFNGILTTKEKDDYFTKQVAAADDLVASSEPEISDAPPLTAKQFEETGVIKPSVNGEYWPLWGVQIRRTLIDVDRQRQKSRFNADSYLAALQPVKAAEFGYVHDSIAGDESWSARGVLALPFNSILENGLGVYVMPNIQFDRVTQTIGATQEVNSLIFGLEGGIITNPAGPLAFSQLSIGPEYGTDFDLQDSKIGGKLEWQPYFEAPWIANLSSQQIGSLPILYRTREFAHFEGGHAEATGATPDTDYARIGAGAGISFFFATKTPLDRVTLGVDYRYYWDLRGDEDEFENFRATAEFRIDEHGHLVLQAAYENGLIPLSQKDIELFTLGIGVKF